MAQPLHDPADEEHTAAVHVSNRLRNKLNELAYRIFMVGKRCVHSPSGREIKPHQSLLLEAAWEVAQRHPGELQSAIMRRTEPREDQGIRAEHLATGHRPR